jgi:hypothetical protein
MIWSKRQVESYDLIILWKCSTNKYALNTSSCWTVYALIILDQVLSEKINTAMAYKLSFKVVC